MYPSSEVVIPAATFVIGPSPLVVTIIGQDQRQSSSLLRQAARNHSPRGWRGMRRLTGSGFRLA
jgi:hypothetical protein